MDDVSASSPSPQPAAPKKSTTTLSVDRAAFLLLRVKKAFKKKRQQRKEKQNQLTNSVLVSQGRLGRKIPPPLLRSRTLPAIIVPSIPVVSLQSDRTQFQLEERLSGGGSGSKTPGGGSRCWSTLLTRNTGISTTATTPSGSSGYNNNNNSTIKSLNLPRDDSTLVYRRKSSGSTPHSTSVSGAAQQQQQQQQQLQQQYQGMHLSDAAVAIAISASTSSAYMPASCDDFECQADGSLLLRIPAPHVVAARAYRLASKKRSTASTVGSSGSGFNEVRATDVPLTPTGFDCSPVTGSYVGNTASGNVNSSFGTASSGNASTSIAGNAANTALTRLAKLLHQSSTVSTTNATTAAKATIQQQQQQQLQQIGSDYIFPIGGDEAPRRLSWERRKDSSALQRSASIDSFAEIVFSDSPRPSLDIPRSTVPFSKRPSASSLFSNCSISSAAQLNINYGDGSSIIGGSSIGTGTGGNSGGNSRRESMLSPSSTRRNKTTRIINGKLLLLFLFFLSCSPSFFLNFLAK